MRWYLDVGVPFRVEEGAPQREFRRALSDATDVIDAIGRDVEGIVDCEGSGCGFGFRDIQFSLKEGCDLDAVTAQAVQIIEAAGYENVNSEEVVRKYAYASVYGEPDSWEDAQEIGYTREDWDEINQVLDEMEAASE